MKNIISSFSRLSSFSKSFLKDIIKKHSWFVNCINMQNINIVIVWNILSSFYIRYAWFKLNEANLIVWKRPKRKRREQRFARSRSRDLSSVTEVYICAVTPINTNSGERTTTVWNLYTLQRVYKFLPLVNANETCLSLPLLFIHRFDSNYFLGLAHFSNLSPHSRDNRDRSNDTRLKFIKVPPM